jgi:hypothetical protein
MRAKCSRNLTTRSVVGRPCLFRIEAIAAMLRAYDAIQPVASDCSSV